MLEITRKVEFDAGHRIPDHKSKCRNAHGHRYVLEATVTGQVLENAGSDTGMIVDFGDLKTIMVAAVAEPWDHAFLCYEDDTDMRTALAHLGPSHKTVFLPFIPTVENLTQHAATLIEHALDAARASVRLSRVRLYETPNCWADAYPRRMRGL